MEPFNMTPNSPSPLQPLSPSKPEAPKPVRPNTPYLLGTAAATLLWLMLYDQLHLLADSITHLLSETLGFSRQSHLGEAIAFFIYDTPKVLMLMALVVFGVGILRSFFTPEKTRAALAGKGAFTGNILAALLGIVTPFCSCSAVPLFLGFVTAGVPLGATFSFLIAAPMVNEIALVLLYSLFGWKIAALYLVTGLAIAMVAGWVIGKMKMESHLESWVHLVQSAPTMNSESKPSWGDRIAYGLDAVKEIVGKVWIYILAGIAIGAAIHGYVPEGVLAGFMGKSAWWSVPLSVILGIPMYSNAAGIIPIVQALLGKGAALGTVLAFMMSVIALSLPEMIILRKVLKPKLIGTFIAVVGVGILLVGWLFNIVIG
ncbi:MAG: permease [Desulfobacterales bacterium]|nr:permease [Desulfobacterales bacterium]